MSKTNTSTPCGSEKQKFSWRFTRSLSCLLMRTDFLVIRQDQKLKFCLGIPRILGKNFGKFLAHGMFLLTICGLEVGLSEARGGFSSIWSITCVSRLRIAGCLYNGVLSRLILDQINLILFLRKFECHSSKRTARERSCRDYRNPS